MSSYWRIGAECFEQVATATPGAAKPYEFCDLVGYRDKQDKDGDGQKWCAGPAWKNNDAKGIQKKDKLLLQSYGRPYDAKGSPAPTSYYSFAKSPGEVTTGEAWAALGTSPRP